MFNHQAVLGENLCSTAYSEAMGGRRSKRATWKDDGLVSMKMPSPASTPWLPFLGCGTERGEACLLASSINHGVRCSEDLQVV